MWNIDNNTLPLSTITELSETKTAKTVHTYDFSTLYTNIPHDDLKVKMRWIVDKAFHNNSKHCMYVSNYRNSATWYKRRNTYSISKEKLLDFIDYLIDNIYVTAGNHVFRQTVGIPMGTDCAPYLANLYLYAIEFNYLNNLMKSNIHTARKLSLSYRFI